ncbi:hypothetical protein PsYK624_051020 [Phanerochaete sordida]|uniref:Uncharacterized protein n=1 Tax=Phanerochaete sordida TaxID=48140 RepID=A0A9P3G4I6_9APHY|nr:hypothetical protein PsYK624_051020 [Phanerochaete sordida]
MSDGLAVGTIVAIIVVIIVVKVAVGIGACIWIRRQRAQNRTRKPPTERTLEAGASTRAESDSGQALLATSTELASVHVPRDPPQPDPAPVFSRENGELRLEPPRPDPLRLAPRSTVSLSYAAPSQAGHDDGESSRVGHGQENPFLAPEDAASEAAHAQDARELPPAYTLEAPLVPVPMRGSHLSER